MAKGKSNIRLATVVEDGTGGDDNLIDKNPNPLPVPEYVIRADSEFGLRVMVSAFGLSSVLDADGQAVVATKMREFELYEEAIRTAGDPLGGAAAAAIAE